MRLSHVCTAQFRPVAVFLYGGAWASGSKELYTAAGTQLVAEGFVAVIPDYVKHPSGDVRDMVADILSVLHWVTCHAEQYGGDGRRITIIGHSAGVSMQPPSYAFLSSPIPRSYPLLLLCAPSPPAFPRTAFE